jgi:hypothetical protein
VRRAIWWFLAWYRQRALRTQILVALVLIVVFMGCSGLLTPSLR